MRPRISLIILTTQGRLNAVNNYLNIEKYSNTLATHTPQQSPGYAIKKFLDFTYKISKKLHLSIYLKQKLFFWTSKSGISRILRLIANDLQPYLLKKSRIAFCTLKVKHLQGTFKISPLEKKSYKLFFSSEIGIICSAIKEFFGQDNIVVLKLGTDVELSSGSRALKFKPQNSVFRYFGDLKGTFVCKNLDNLNLHFETFKSFISFLELNFNRLRLIPLEKKYLAKFIEY